MQTSARMDRREMVITVMRAPVDNFVAVADSTAFGEGVSEWHVVCMRDDGRENAGEVSCLNAISFLTDGDPNIRKGVRDGFLRIEMVNFFEHLAVYGGRLGGSTVVRLREQDRDFGFSWISYATVHLSECSRARSLPSPGDSSIDRDERHGRPATES